METLQNSCKLVIHAFWGRVEGLVKWYLKHYQNHQTFQTSIFVWILTHENQYNVFFFQWCFVNKKGLTQNCSCKNKACGCLDASKVIPSPRCDGSSIPRVINYLIQLYCLISFKTHETPKMICFVIIVVHQFMWSKILQTTFYDDRTHQK